MLDELRIRGLGVIDDATLPLGPGLTVVTGETGAGKTMVVTGLLLLFGGRAEAARVRAGADSASVDGRLRLPAAGPAACRVRDAGGALDDIPTGAQEYSPDSGGAPGSPPAHEAELVVRRVVQASGRSRAYVGGAPVPVAVLSDLAEDLVAVHGQSDQLRLSRPGAQRAALDRFAGIDLSDYSAAFAQWRAAAADLDDRKARTAELRREADVLRHGLAEIATVDPQPGEADALALTASRLGSAEALTGAARAAHDALLGDADDPLGQGSDVGQLLAIAVRATSQLRPADPELDALAGRLAELSALAADLGQDFGAYASAVDADPAQLEQVQARRAALQALTRKYGDDPHRDGDGVLRWAAAARARLDEIDVSDTALAALQARRDDAARAAAVLADEVARRRRAAADRLAEQVTGELHGLAMPDARLTVQVAGRPVVAGAAVLDVAGVEVGATADGADEVRLLLQAHAGAPALPLGRGASGGELSRVMLALELSLAGTDPVPTSVFDEIDAGVGGRAAVEVGRRLARLARDRQVLVVTHLAQVAAFADRHVVVDKPVVDEPVVDEPVGGKPGSGAAVTQAGGVTASDVRLVDGERRIVELARMLAGSDTVTAREHAAELLATAEADAARRMDPGAASAAPSGASSRTVPRRAAAQPRGSAELAHVES